MEYNLPWRIVLGSALVGLALDSVDFLDKIRKVFEPTQYTINDSYLFLDVSATLPQYGGQDFQEILEQAGKDFKNWTFADTEYALSILEHEDISDAAAYFCERVSEGATEFPMDQCVEGGAIQDAEIAFYRISNDGERFAKEISFNMQSFEGTTPAYETMDTFLNDYKITTECLRISDESLADECVSKDFGDIEVIEISRGLEAGEILHIPMYLALRMNFDGDYSGYIKLPLRVPVQVVSDGDVIIQEPRSMSPSPTVVLGTYEIRG